MGFQIHVNASDINQAIEKVGKYNIKTAANIENAIEQSAKAVRDNAQRRAPRKKGGLQKGIRARFFKNTATGYVEAMAPHSHLIELGVKASNAKPKNKKAMTIGDKFAASANIPDRAARPFMKPAFEEEKPRIIERIEKAVNKE